MKFKPNEIDGRSIVNCDGTSDVIEIVSKLCDQQTELLETIAQQGERITHLEAEITEKDETIEQVHERVTDLEDELESYRESNERDKADIRQDVTENARQTEASEKHTEAVARKVETLDGSEQRTPLEQIVRLPEEIIHKAKLTANQRRARAIASEIGGLATTVPKGKRLDSTTIKQELKQVYGSAHDQTVARVMSFLDRLGGDRTEVVHTGQGKAVIFDDWLARRLQTAEQFTAEAVDSVLTNVVSVTPRTGS
ncbi:hypothetical protein [Halocatena halophila]|uniref:hypothetical protein n=1 Tax=Halocatena halophila TaxID=2814576 RepID=UPI002ED268B4